MRLRAVSDGEGIRIIDGMVALGGIGAWIYRFFLAPAEG
jgi:hypothetical protein